ncbi:hypothetical protein QYE76_056388 [Lolium multiflorum]|uniref:TF-B3 domain-containing protein n=1 Tax=Lolium multiflorum TaxID=4521 RepID=A0AAD8WMS5_LOLMU|nr:hypothetical protein QYE76_056388 [Lolium multiflorum]
MAASNDDQLYGDWGKLPAELFNLIAQSLDVTVDVRLAACSKTLCRHVADNMNLHHWDGPCLLMPDSAHWHYDDSSAHHTVYHVVPLDHPRRTAILPFMDNRFWVGMNGDWIAGVDSGGNWFLANIYTHQEISLPSSETCNIFREEWIGFPDLPPERYMTYGRAMFLLKIVICEVPTKAGHYSDYKLIALFNSGLAYLANGSQEWRLFSLASWGVDYSDAIEHNGFIVAVDGWTGTTYCWDQSQAEAHELQLDDILVFEVKDTSLMNVLIYDSNTSTQRCSNKKLKLGESLSWKETSVEPAPVCKVFRRIDEENTADSFCKVLCTSELEVITIPSRVLPWFYGGCPESINLKMSTACTWIVDLKQQDGNVLMDAGWPEFVKAHDLKVGYLLTFKKIDTKSLQVLIFGYNCCEKVIWCSGAVSHFPRRHGIEKKKGKVYRSERLRCGTHGPAASS